MLKKLNDDGYAIIDQFLDNHICHDLKQQIQFKLSELILKQGCTENLYFSAVNRWPLEALMNNNVCNEITNLIASKVRYLTNLELEAFEIDILYKSPYAHLATPCHQDIAYVPHKPYLFSTWIPLNDIALTESPLQFLPQSHIDPIQPAIDFWEPNFIDQFRQTSRWQQQAVTIPINVGNAIIFSSAIWHASLDYQGTTERFALVVRWGNDDFIDLKIPSPNKVNFGMWNCGEYTEKILSNSLQQLFNMSSKDYLHSIRLWQKQLENYQAPAEINYAEAYLALEKLRILNEAYLNYRGSDGQGIVYGSVWNNLLSFLKKYPFNEAI